jgi:phage shock protein A
LNHLTKVTYFFSKGPNMNIFKRISDIISANLNDLVEGCEDAEQMLRQAIREMDDAVHKARPDVAKAMANEKSVAKELAANEAQRKTWDTRTIAAVEAGDDALARKGIERRKEYEKIVAALKDQHVAAQEASQMLRRQLEAMEAKLSDAQRRLNTLVARNRAAEIRTKMATSDAGPRLDDSDAFSKFDRLSRKVEMAEAEAEAMAELARSRKPNVEETLEPEADASAESLEVDAELAALKQKLKSKE